MRHTPSTGGILDPRIEKLKEILTRDPKFTKHQAYQSLNISRKTLDRWIANGWIPEMYSPPKFSSKSPWRNIS